MSGGSSARSSSTALKPVDEVVAVVAVAEDRVEPGQRGGVAVDGLPGAPEPVPKVRGIDCDGRGGDRGDPRRGRW